MPLSYMEQLEHVVVTHAFLIKTMLFVIQARKTGCARQDRQWLIREVVY